MSEALSLFNVLFDDLTPTEFIEVSIHGPGDDHPRRIDVGWFKTTIEAANFAQKYSTGHNVWFGVFPRKTEGSTVHAVSRRTCIFVDLDIEPEEGHKKIQRLLIPPTATVYSGQHLQLYFKTKERELDPIIYDKLADQLSAWFGVKANKNVNRLFRVPGTQHVKDPQRPRLCSISMPYAGLEGRAVYSVADLFAAVAISERFRSMALSKVVPHTYSQPDGTPDRSRRDFAIIKHFQTHGMSDEIIRFISHKLPFGERYREDRGHQLIEYDLSASKNEQRLKKPSKTASRSSFREESDGYWFNDAQVSTFTMHPTSVVESPSGDTIICDIKTEHRVWKEVAFERGDFVGVKEFSLKLTSTSWQWLGTPQNFKFLLPYLDEAIRQNKIPRVRGLTYTGYASEYFISDTQSINADGFVESRPFALLDVYNGQYREKIHTNWQEPENETFLRDVMRLLPKINQPHAVWLPFGWFMACPFKAALWTDANMARFPILNSFGTQGAGKSSSVVEIYQRLLGLKEAEFTAGTTDFNVLNHINASNTFPLIVSEFRESNPTSGRFMEYVRQLYMNAVEGRGRANGSTRKYILHRPFVLTGEDGITDAATKERSIRVRYNKKWLNHTPQGQAARDAFDELRQMPLEQFSLPYLRYCLKMIESGEHVKLYQQAHREVMRESKDVPDRVLANMTMVWFGLKAAGEFLGELMPRLTLDIVFKEYLDELLGRAGTVENLGDIFISDMLNQYFMYLSGEGARPDFTCRYMPEDNTFWFKHTTAVSWWLQKRIREGLPRLTSKALLEQIEESKYYIVKKNVSINGCSTYLTGVSIEKAHKSGLEIPDRLPNNREDLTISYETKRS